MYASAAASRASTVSATVTDTDSQVWMNGTWRANLVLPSGPFGNVQPTVNGSPFVTGLNGVINPAGVFTAILTDTSTLDQSGGTWSIQVCPNSSVSHNAASGCYTVTAPIVGATVDLTSRFSSIPAPRFPAGAQAFGYLDIECIPPSTPGMGYYNTGNVPATEGLRLWDGKRWTGTGSGGGGGGGIPQTINLLSGAATASGPARSTGIQTDSATMRDATNIRNLAAQVNSGSYEASQYSTANNGIATLASQLQSSGGTISADPTYPLTERYGYITGAGLNGAFPFGPKTHLQDYRVGVHNNIYSSWGLNGWTSASDAEVLGGVYNTPDPIYPLLSGSNVNINLLHINPFWNYGFSDGSNGGGVVAHDILDEAHVPFIGNYSSLGLSPVITGLDDKTVVNLNPSGRGGSTAEASAEGFVEIREGYSDLESPSGTVGAVVDNGDGSITLTAGALTSYNVGQGQTVINTNPSKVSATTQTVTGAISNASPVAVTVGTIVASSILATVTNAISVIHSPAMRPVSTTFTVTTSTACSVGQPIAFWDQNDFTAITAVGTLSGGQQTISAPLLHTHRAGAEFACGGSIQTAVEQTALTFNGRIYVMRVYGATAPHTLYEGYQDYGAISSAGVASGAINIYPAAQVLSPIDARSNTVSGTQWDMTASANLAVGDSWYSPNDLSSSYKGIAGGPTLFNPLEHGSSWAEINYHNVGARASGSIFSINNDQPTTVYDGFGGGSLGKNVIDTKGPLAGIFYEGGVMPTVAGGHGYLQKLGVPQGLANGTNIDTDIFQTDTTDAITYHRTVGGANGTFTIAGALDVPAQFST